MKVKVVTGYVPLPVLNCSQERFQSLGEQLMLAVPVPLRVYLEDITDCWLLRELGPSRCREIRPQWPLLPRDRFVSAHDAVLSDIVMHQKQEWLALAALEDPEPDVFIWIDYGVMKQIDMTPAVITDFILRVEAKRVIDEVEAPGIRQMEPVDDTQSWDRFCGSVLVVPRHRLFDLHRAMKQTAMDSIRKTGVITIESNTLAHVELQGKIPFRWYPAWWGASMFTSY